MVVISEDGKKPFTGSAEQVALVLRVLRNSLLAVPWEEQDAVAYAVAEFLQVDRHCVWYDADTSMLCIRSPHETLTVKLNREEPIAQEDPL